MNSICINCPFDCKGQEYCTRFVEAKDIITTNTVSKNGQKLK